MPHVRAFRPGDVEARGVDPTRFRQKSTNSCWPAAPRRAPAPPPPPECERPRCHKPADDDGWCERHGVEERQWLAVDVEQLRRMNGAGKREMERATDLLHQRLADARIAAPRGHPDGSPSPRHTEGSTDG